MEKSEKERTSESLIDIKESGEVAKAYSKLSKKYVEVMVNDRQNEIDLLELDELTIKSNIGTVDSSAEAGAKLLKEAEDALGKIDKERKLVEKNTVKAYLVPLLYRDSRIVQTAITEALFSIEGMDFDNDVKIHMAFQEKKIMTVYLSLRKHGVAGSERYYGSLEEIAKVSDRTIDKLYETFVNEFELGTAEIKKS